MTGFATCRSRDGPPSVNLGPSLTKHRVLAPAIPYNTSTRYAPILAAWTAAPDRRGKRSRTKPVMSPRIGPPEANVHNRALGSRPPSARLCSSPTPAPTPRSTGVCALPRPIVSLPSTRTITRTRPSAQPSDVERIQAPRLTVRGFRAVDGTPYNQKRETCKSLARHG